MEENIDLARRFVQEQLVSRGMIADLAVHLPEKEEGGILTALSRHGAHATT